MVCAVSVLPQCGWLVWLRDRWEEREETQGGWQDREGEAKGRNSINDYRTWGWLSVLPSANSKRPLFLCLPDVLNATHCIFSQADQWNWPLDVNGSGSVSLLIGHYSVRNYSGLHTHIHTQKGKRLLCYIVLFETNDRTRPFWHECVHDQCVHDDTHAHAHDDTHRLTLHISH